MKRHVIIALFFLFGLFATPAVADDLVGEYAVNHKVYGGGLELSKDKDGTYTIDCGVLLPENDRARVEGFFGKNGRRKGKIISFDVPEQNAKVSVDFSNPKKVTMKVTAGNIIFGPEYSYSKD